MGWCLVQPSFGQAVAHHVFARGDHGALPGGCVLDAPDVGTAELGREVGVFAVCLFEPSPAWVPGDVEDRRQCLARPGRPQMVADATGHLLGQGWIPRRGKTDGLGEAGGTTGHHAVQGFLVDDRRYPQPCLLDQEALDGVSQLCHLGRGQVRGTGDSGDLAQPIRHPLAGAGPIQAGTVEDLEGPQRTQLRQLLGQRHPGHEVACPLLDGKGVVPVGQAGGLGRDPTAWSVDGMVRHGLPLWFRHPLTAPAVRPPTIWRSAMT